MGVQKEMEKLAGAAARQVQQAEARSAAGQAREMNADTPASPAGQPVLDAKEAVRLMHEEKARRGMDPVSKEGEDDDDPALGFDIEDVGDPVSVSTDPGDVPAWVVMPKDMVFPEGWQICFLRFPSKMTNAPKKGAPCPDDASGQLYRQCIMWNLSERDEKIAARRANGVAARVVDEMAKMMIRAVDGRQVNYIARSGPDSLSLFWNEIGGKFRHTIKSVYLKTHTLDAQENADFFERCVALRTVS